MNYVDRCDVGQRPWQPNCTKRVDDDDVLNELKETTTSLSVVVLVVD
jgi:hypothetical protein